MPSAVAFSTRCRFSSYPFWGPPNDARQEANSRKWSEGRNGGLKLFSERQSTILFLAQVKPVLLGPLTPLALAVDQIAQRLGTRQFLARHDLRHRRQQKIDQRSTWQTAF